MRTDRPTGLGTGACHPLHPPDQLPAWTGLGAQLGS
jgi:hypothetical protein